MLSVLLYLVLFGALSRFPLSRGLLESALDVKFARLAALGSPKLVIIAGSNAPYSHSCAVLSAALAMPCENAGLAVGYGLDELLARAAPDLHQGDVVYLPIELRQYAATRRDYARLADGEMLWRDRRGAWARLPPWRRLGAALCCTALDAVEAAIEQPLSHLASLQPGAILARQYAPNGDRIDNARTAAVAPAGEDPAAVAIADGYGAALVGDFVRAERARGVTVVGGLPTEAGGVLSADRLAAVAKIYGWSDLVILATASRYPVADFSNSPDHLTHACQLLHTIALAQLLGPLLQRPLEPLPDDMQREAATCPSALHLTALN